MTEKIDPGLASLFEHLQKHDQWPKVAAIKNQTIVARQDDERVGLLQVKGIRDVLEVKQAAESDFSTC